MTLGIHFVAYLLLIVADRNLTHQGVAIGAWSSIICLLFVDLLLLGCFRLTHIWFLRLSHLDQILFFEFICIVLVCIFCRVTTSIDSSGLVVAILVLVRAAIGIMSVLLLISHVLRLLDLWVDSILTFCSGNFTNSLFCCAFALDNKTVLVFLVLLAALDQNSSFPGRWLLLLSL